MEPFEYFAVNIFMLKCAGLWYPSSKLHLLFNIVSFIYTACLFPLSQLLLMVFDRENLEDFMKNASTGMTDLLCTYKFLLFYFNRDVIYESMKILDRNIAPFENTDEEVREDMIFVQKLAKRFLGVAMITAFGTYASTLLTLIFNPGSNTVYKTDVYNATKMVYTQKLPFLGWIPWNYTASKKSFLMAVMLQVFPTFNSIFVIVGFDTLFTSIISYISCQIKIVQGAFRTIRPRTYEKLGLEYRPVLRETDAVNEELNKELVKGIKALQVIFELCEKMESIFTYVTLAQVMISLIVLCTCLYLVSSVPITSEKFIIEAIYMLAIEIQLAMYCYFGNKVTLRGEDIPLSLYEGDWFSADAKFKKSMLITMTRMRRPIHLTIGKFTPLTLATFVTIGRGSYSFFAVIKSASE